MKRALFIGIDDYTHSPLHGCVADARAMSEMLRRHGNRSANYAVRLVTSDHDIIERTHMRTRLVELFENSKGSDLFFYFAGHGTKSPWGAELVTQNYQKNSMGVSMNDLVTLANASPASEVVIILDCCYSGDLANLPGLQPEAISESFRQSVAVLREGVTFLAASRATETSKETGGHGTFTRLLLDGLEGAAADQLGNVTALSLYDFASRAFDGWDQRPVFKSHVTQPSVLRVCEPPIDRQLLLKMTEHFPTADHRFQLTPEHEGVRPIPSGAQPTNEQLIFDYLKALRNAGLLELEGGKDLYWASLESGKALLTRQGRYFWTLAKNNKL